MRREEKKEAALHPGAGGEGRMAKLCGGEGGEEHMWEKGRITRGKEGRKG